MNNEIIDYTKEPYKKRFDPTKFFLGRRNCTIYLNSIQYRKISRLWAYICIEIEERNIKIEVLKNEN